MPSRLAFGRSTKARARLEELLRVVARGSGRGGFFFEIGVSSDVQTLHPVAQGMAAHLQLLGGPVQAEVILLENGGDQFALKVVHKVLERLTASGSRGGGAVQLSLDLEIRQANRLNRGAGFQDERALDDVAQLAHVAGPVVC